MAVATLGARIGAVGALALVAACGDNASVHDAAIPPPRDARIDGAPPFPDLTLVKAQMDGSVLITNDSFTASDCELVEGCVGGVGSRRLLRFDTITENIGTADLDLGPTPPPGTSAGIFVWSPCHMHHHVMGFANFDLLDGTGVVIAGHKQAFCLEDDEQVTPISASHGYNCGDQGISPGWADVYGRGLPCQWIDVSDVAPGAYTLRVVVDPDGVLPDRDPTNNEWTAPVTL